MSSHQVLSDSERARRQLQLSKRHRTWHSSFYMADVDEIVAMEYDRTEPVALIEYKRADTSRPEDANTAMMARLAQRAGIRAYLVLYWPQEPHWRFTIKRLQPANDLGTLSLDEPGYVAWMRQLREWSATAMPDT